MDNMGYNKVQPAVRKAKEKHAKDELDRIKQAEKKKRRLEKALATSAAIRSELEKKKERKREEQQRLDEEGAAISEAVALHVLLGEDNDNSCNMVLDMEEDFNSWEFKGRGRAYLPYQAHTNCARSVSNAFTPESTPLADMGNNNWSFSYGQYRNDLRAAYFERGWDSEGLAAGIFAAEAVSALQITDNSKVETMILNSML